jgi:hypothetical protein
VPAPLVGLRCLSPPTPEESDAAFDALAVLRRSTKNVGLRRTRVQNNAEETRKSPSSPIPYFSQFLRKTSQPALKIAGTLARPSVTGEALVSASVKPSPQQGGAAATETKTTVAVAPLLVFEDRGTLASIANAVRDADDAPQTSVLPACAPQRAPQDPAPNGVPASGAPQVAQAGAVSATNVTGGLPPLSRLHEEVAAFAAAAWPTRVRFERIDFFSSDISPTLRVRLFSLPLPSPSNLVPSPLPTDSLHLSLSLYPKPLRRASQTRSATP